MTKGDIVGWHHRLNGHKFEGTPGDNEGKGGLMCYSPWSCKELDTTEQLNNNSVILENIPRVNNSICCLLFAKYLTGYFLFLK